MKRTVQKLNHILRRRKRFSHADKIRIYERDKVWKTPNAFCRYCSRPVTFDEAQICHWWPWSLFGPNADWNLFPGHGDCNREAGDSQAGCLMLLPLEFFLGLALITLIMFGCLFVFLAVKAA